MWGLPWHQENTQGPAPRERHLAPIHPIPGPTFDPGIITDDIYIAIANGDTGSDDGVIGKRHHLPIFPVFS